MRFSLPLMAILACVPATLAQAQTHHDFVDLFYADLLEWEEMAQERQEALIAAIQRAEPTNTPVPWYTPFAEERIPLLCITSPSEGTRKPLVCGAAYRQVEQGCVVDTSGATARVACDTPTPPKTPPTCTAHPRASGGWVALCQR